MQIKNEESEINGKTERSIVFAHKQLLEKSIFVFI